MTLTMNFFRTLMLAILFFISRDVFAISSTGNGVNLTPSTLANRSLIGIVPVAFYGQTPIFNCPSQATSSVPVLSVQDSASMYTYYMGLGLAGTVSAFNVCNIAIKYWSSETLMSAAMSQYGLSLSPAACSPLFGNYSNYTCQMYPQNLPDTSVCYDDSAWYNTYGSSGNACIAGTDKIAFAYGAPEAPGAYITYSGTNNSVIVPRCNSGTSLRLVGSGVSGTSIYYSFTYPVEMQLLLNACIGSVNGSPWICGGTTTPCPITSGSVLLKTGVVNQITILPPFPPTGFVSSTTKAWNGKPVMIVTSSAMGKPP